MIGNSKFEYIWVVSWAAILHSIGPLSLIYCVSIALLPHIVPSHRYVLYGASAETLFYIWTCLYQRYYLQRPAEHPLPTSKEERNKLFEQCLESTQDHEQYISRWFLNAPLSAIKRENVKEFFRWAFLNTDVADSSFDDELDMYVMKLEERLGREFQPGRSDVKSLRLTLDKVDALHRSLVWYMV